MPPSRSSASPAPSGGRLAALRAALAALGLAVLVVLAAAAAPPQAAAQSLPAAAPPAAEDAKSTPATNEEIDGLIDTLKDETERARLVRQLELLRTADGPPEQATEFEAIGAAAVAYVTSTFSGVEQAVDRLTFAVESLPGLAAEVTAVVTDPERRHGAVAGILQLVIAMGTAVIAYGLVQRLLARLRDHLGRRAAGTGPVAHVAIAAVCFVLALIPVGAFLAVGFVALGALAPSRPVEAIGLTILNAGAVTGVFGAALRTLLAPHAATLRPVPMSDATARSLHLSFIATAGLAIWGYFFIGSLYLLGLGFTVRWGLLLVLGVVVAVVAIRFVVHWHKPFATWLTATVPPGRWYSTVVGRLATSWHRIAIVYIVVLCSIGALQIVGGFIFVLRGTVATVLVLALVPILAARVGDAIERADFGWPALATARGRRYRALVRRIFTAALWVGGVLLLMEGWHLGALSFLETNAGRLLTGILGRIFFVVVVGYAAWEIANVAIEARLNASGAAATLGQRGRTLLQFLRNVVLVVILVMVVLTVLSELGIDIAPLLAGAGVVGLAVGFGAQTVVKDVITGLFILLEDQVQVGDVVELGGNSGAVEAMSIRTIRLRDFAGTVHIIPFSSVDRVKNLTRGFAFAVFDVGIGYKEDIDRVIGVLRRLGEELRADPQFSHHLLGDLEIYGLDQFGASALVLKNRFKTMPGSQWTITREFNARIKRAFDAEGIEIPFNYQTIALPAGPDGKTIPIPLEIVGRRRPAPEPPPSPEFRAPDARGDEAPSTQIGGG